MLLQRNRIRFNLLTQIVILISVMVLISMFLAKALFSDILDDLLKQSIGQQAMMVAKLTANDEGIIAAFDDPNPPFLIQPRSEWIRQLTEADYVVIGNRKGLRYSHNDPQHIGYPMSTSNDAVLLENKSVIYEGTGVSGPAIKAKTPIWNNKGEVIGVSSVGFLLNDVEKQVSEYKEKVVKLSLLLLALGVTGAIVIARRVKKLIFNLEPEEISFLLKEKEAILESIRDAIVAVDRAGRIISINKRAREVLRDYDLAVGGQIKDPRLQETISEIIRTRKNIISKKILLGHQLYVLDLSPILQQLQVKGVVFTIRSISEIEQLTDEVSKIKHFSDNMRAQNHEYLNKLNTIYGLVSLKQYDKAIEVISDEVKDRQEVIAFLMSSVKDPLIAACLLGKMNRSKELKVSLEIDRESNLTSTSQMLESKSIVTILGNIIDNAMEAAREKQGSKAEVKVSFTDLGRDIVFDVEDNGAGVPKEWEKSIFMEGFSTKNGENRGLGLNIVKNTLALLDGHIYIGESHLGGASFTIAIPKRNEGDEPCPMDPLQS